MSNAVFEYIVYPILAALLLWLGWLIKVQIENVQSSKKLNNEIYITLKTFHECQGVMLDSMRGISEGLMVALMSNDLQFQTFHDSGIMNGESVRHREQISEKLESLKQVVSNIQEMKKQFETLSDVATKMK